MKTRECIRCEKFFECNGKDTDKPCLFFKERTTNEVQEQKSKG